MKKPQCIYWIDDNPDRASTANDVGATFIDLTAEAGVEHFERVFEDPEPRLVVVDHILDHSADGLSHLFRRGSTIAGAVKERWPRCPVVGVTNADNLNSADLRGLETYDDLFKFEDFEQNIDRIRLIAEGFAKVSRIRNSSPQRIIRQLRPPSEDVDRLESILPETLKRSRSAKGLASEIYAWVENLRSRPGFLFDRLWAATHLGLNERGYRLTEANFAESMYDGIFLHPRDPRWWRTLLTAKLYEQCEPDVGEFPWQVGRRLPNVTRKHFSKCYVCGEEYPETVAYVDEVSDERHAMHLKCTVAHPGFKRALLFEDIRMMKEG